MHFGFEREFLLMRGKEVVLPGAQGGPSFMNPFPMDADGIHVEARTSGGFATPLLAAGALTAEIHRLEQIAEKQKASLVAEDWFKLPPKMKQILRREAGKGLLQERSLYGEVRPPRVGWSAGGLHIHFGPPPQVNGKCKCGREYPLWHHFAVDIPRIVLALDKQFGDAIKAAGRQKGRYELKYHGGFEYRSLPASLSQWEVADFITSSKDFR